MKSIIKARTTKKIYYMERSQPLSWWGYSIGIGDFKYNDKSDNDGRLGFKKTKDLELITLKETDQFHRLLDKGESISIEGNHYEIAEVVHGVDGIMEYWVDVEYDDEKSRDKALKEIELRGAFLEGRKVESEKVKLINTDHIVSSVLHEEATASKKARKILNKLKKARSKK
ncbi:hypothetical protein G7L40_20340 [Paenibacillus polymyxa]|uniref:Uncharacterized protein n=1 Tax=Paenibacillus polymyxa TaxID=1406 RepID=A0A378Y094_PAEPO|nr:hypothetical protein [Paenibacillus polymyxa]MBE7896161.1 hypothetical protein [Paenibacillus polymyxa]MBG9765893.1 hypothetical protein [Paenibacillus polymyxa]MCC3256690.1 hypothetical protein [Paenibacillus polymyxa]QPK54819.1 hypothetical protein G7035_20385 [Paenibacillus polymyxa]QPK59910.1 hypothetical protein G7L40_20340 [Paenibacillus polymyxa]